MGDEQSRPQGPQLGASADASARASGEPGSPFRRVASSPAMNERPKEDAAKDAGPRFDPKRREKEVPDRRRGKSPGGTSPSGGGKLIVIKVGTSSIMAPDPPLRANVKNLGTLVEVIGALTRQGHQVVLVASGAVGMGCLKLNCKRPTSLAAKQAVAAAGQARLMRLFEDLFALCELQVAQLLITRGDFSDMARFKNIRATLRELLDMGVLPIINENDSVAVEELRIGDNDSLAAMTAVLMSAHWLFLLTDVDFVYDGNPRVNPDAKPIKVVDQTVGFSVMGASSGGQWGTGGMATKLVAASTVACAGIHCGLLHGEHPERIASFLTEKDCEGTWFCALAQTATMRDQRRWILSLPLSGHVVLDDGARKAVLARKSLFAAGIVAVEGSFLRDSCVVLRARNASGEEEEIGRALMNFSSEELGLLKRRQTSEFEAILGYCPSSNEAASRDNIIPVLPPE